MADGTKIEWTDASWTPIRARNKATGKIGWHCEHVSPGCVNCYAESFNERRLGTGLPFKPGHRNDVEHFLDEAMLLQPLRWRRPRMIFVCSMTDLFGDWVPDAMLDRIFAVMALASQHTLQVLTKRADRIREYLTHPMVQARIAVAMARITAKGSIEGMVRGREIVGRMEMGEAWPLPNVWLGVSAEDQRRVEERVPVLLDTPAAVRWVSAEPLLGPIDFRSWLTGTEEAGLVGNCIGWKPPLDWIVTGGESGPGARPTNPQWFRGIRDQCAAADVAFLFKQWGEWAPHRMQVGGDLGGDVRSGRVRIVHAEEHSDDELCKRSFYSGDRYMRRVGKTAAGRILDGVTHDGYPQCEEVLF